jgi:hypothetical protein
MENGCASVCLIFPDGDHAILPDADDKTIVEQLSDALDAALVHGRVEHNHL